MFWSLVKHEARWRMGNRNTKTNFHRWNWLIYTSFITLIGILGMTALASTKSIDPQKMFYFFFAYPFVLFTLAGEQFGHEWKYQTIGWWLTLPYSRVTLMMAKFVAVLWKGFLMLISLLIVTIVLYYYLLIIDAPVKPIEPSAFLLSGCKWFLVVICSNPFIISMGLLFSVLWYSIYRTKTLIAWGVLCVLYIILSSNNLWEIAGSFLSWEYTPILIAITVVSWVISYGLIYWSAYLLERKLNL